LLIKAIVPLLEKHRHLRLWILGDSRERGKIFESLRHYGQHRVVAMPGVFTDLDPVFSAADACVFPAAQQGLGWLLPTCIANAIPFLVSDSLQVRHMLGEQASELTFAAGQVVELRSKLADWLHDAGPLAAAAARVNRQWLAAKPSGVECKNILQLLAGQRQVPDVPQ
jgi:glycosyltransferase involved in cell wall biosynthesis